MKMFAYALVVGLMAVTTVHADQPTGEQPLPAPVDQYPDGQCQPGGPCAPRCATGCARVCEIVPVGPGIGEIWVNGQLQYPAATAPQIESALIYYREIGICDVIAPPRRRGNPQYQDGYGGYRQPSRPGYPPPMVPPRY